MQNLLRISKLVAIAVWELLTKLEFVFILYIFFVVACCGRAAVTMALMYPVVRFGWLRLTIALVFGHICMDRSLNTTHAHKHEAQKHAKNLFLPEYNIIMNYVIQKNFRKLGM